MHCMDGCVCRVCPALIWHYIGIYVFGCCRCMVATIVVLCFLVVVHLFFLHSLECSIGIPCWILGIYEFLILLYCVCWYAIYVCVVLCNIVVNVAMCQVELFDIKSSLCWEIIHSRRGVFSRFPYIVHIWILGAELFVHPWLKCTNYGICINLKKRSLSSWTQFGVPFLSWTNFLPQDKLLAENLTKSVAFREGFVHWLLTFSVKAQWTNFHSRPIIFILQSIYK
jgi:hypothetical protein